MTTEIETGVQGGRIDDFWGAGDGTLVHLELPDGVVEVGQGAFSDLPHLVSVRLPDTVRIIGSCAFQNCPLLEEVRLPRNLSEVRGAFAETPRLRRIFVDKTSPMRLEGALLLQGDTLLRVFASMLNMSHLRLPDGVRHIAGGALAGCASLERVELPAGLESIGGGAFSGCTRLAEIHIPETVQRIGGAAFAGATRLAELVLSDAVEDVGEWCCDGCVSLRRVDLPGRLRCPANAFPTVCEWRRRNPVSLAEGTAGGGECREIAPYAFAESSALVNLVLPETVERIGTGAFQRCPNVRSIRLPRNLKLIERNAFAFLLKLEEIEIPDGIAEIPQGCFWNCVSLRRVRLPFSLRTINRYAFRDCTMLEEIELPEGLATLVSGAFFGCRRLRRVTFPDSLKVLGSGDFLTPDGKFPGTFEGCESLAEARLPDGLKFLGDHSFSNCTDLRRVRLPTNLECWNRNVFSGCSSDLVVEIASAVPRALPRWVETVLHSDAGPLGFLFALAEEAEPFARCFGITEGIALGRLYSLGKHRLMVCGAGRANAAAGTIRLAREGCRVVVDIGLCGSCGVSCDSGRVFAPEICWDGDAYSQNPGEDLLDPAHVNEGLQFRNEPPVYTVSGLAMELRTPVPVLVDNEAYAVAAVADTLGIHRLFIKVVSDQVNGGTLSDFRQALRSFGDCMDAVGIQLVAHLDNLVSGGKTEKT